MIHKIFVKQRLLFILGTCFFVYLIDVLGSSVFEAVGLEGPIRQGIKWFITAFRENTIYLVTEN